MEITKTQEANRKVTASFQGSHLAELKESVKHSYGLDLDDPEMAKLVDFSDPSFSLRKLREATVKYCTSTREANSASALGALLRVGVQSQVNAMYQAVQTDGEKIVMSVTSNKAIELYAPLYRAGFPRRVGDQEEFPAQKASGLDIQIKNEKFGGMLAFSREVIEDDQTAQIAQQPAQLGENMKILEDAWIFQRLLGTSGTFAGDAIPASQTYSGGVYNNATYGNKPAGGFSAFSSGNIQALDILLMNMTDANGNKMLVVPDTIFAGPGLKWPLKTLLESDSYPSTASMKASGGGTDTAIGTTYAKNVLKGAYQPVVSRFLPGTAYGLMQSGRGLVMQRRRPLEVVQENAVSGSAFAVEVFRYKVSARWEPDWLEPRFAALGSDGTV